MTFAEVLPAAKLLNATENRKLVDEILKDLHAETALDEFRTAAAMPRWTAGEAYEAAHQMQMMLDEGKPQ